MSTSDQPAKSAFPTLVILGIVALSIILFFAFTLPYFRNRGAKLAAAPAGAPVATPAEAPGSPSAAGPSSGETSPTKPGAEAAPSTPAVSSAGSSFAKPEELTGELVRSLKSGKMDAAIAIIGKGALDEKTEERFRILVKEGGYRLDDENPVEEIGRINSSIRYGFNFSRPAGGALDADEKRILVDLDRKDPAQGWIVSNLHIPTFSALSLASVAAGSPEASPVAAVPEPMVVEAPADGPKDPLMLAHEFVEAIMNQDFAKAKSLIADDSVTEEKLAGLFIVTEEGGFERNAKSPLVATATKGDTAWVIAQMANSETRADFGLEIVKAADGSGDWKIAALNLDSLLLARAKMADADDVTYTPIIKNPSGGDSLVLYFGYDDSGLHPRAARQIEIVANILKDDPNKKIMIGGHADAKGPDDYNEQLSRRRAASVRIGLLKAGVPAAQIVTSAFGENSPISPNVQPDGSDNPTGRKRNRRAEVYLNF